MSIVKLASGQKMNKLKTNLSTDEFSWLQNEDGIPSRDKLIWARNYLGRNHLAMGLDKSKLDGYLEGKDPVRANATMYLFIERMKRAYAQYKRRFKKVPVSFSVNHKAATELERLSNEHKLAVSTIVEQIVYEKLNYIGVMAEEPIQYRFAPISRNSQGLTDNQPSA